VESEDAELVRRCLVGDQAACARLVGLYSRVAGTVIWRAVRDPDLVEDLCQETFLRAFRGLDRFDGRSRLSTWICSIAHRVAIDQLRRTGTLRAISFEESALADDMALLEAPLADPQHLVLREEERALVHDALRRLPDRYRLPLLYVAIQGLGYDQVATMLGLPVGSVKTLVFRGKQQLRESLRSLLAESNGARLR
jgi:RNA polymerase sigma-70 factor (ECF subfamily)